MCSVIGLLLNKPTKEDFKLVRNVFIESGIRGLHATGMSFLPNWSDRIQTIIEAKPVSYFVENHLHVDNFKNLLNEDGNLYLIGHCRYSTSDLEYNQPIYNEEISIVHNGVVSQELPENWEKLYGYKTSTKNDSELILKTIEAGKEPLVEWQDSSISVIVLRAETKTLSYYRNGKRPIYVTELNNGIIVTSTKDIMKRASNGSKVAEEVPANLAITFDGENFIKEPFDVNIPDLQNA
jgi:asparagine synthetase B (glutamine-hydrolysing)